MLFITYKLYTLDFYYARPTDITITRKVDMKIELLLQTILNNRVFYNFIKNIITASELVSQTSMERYFI